MWSHFTKKIEVYASLDHYGSRAEYMRKGTDWKQIEENFKVNMFERQQLAFYIKDKIEILPYSQLQYAYNNNFINNETLFFNNLVATKRELEEKWISPLYKTWLASKINAMVN